MESAPTISPPVASARRCPSADLPLAVGPAISQMRGSMFSITLVSPDPDAARDAYHMAQTALNGEGRELGPGAFDILSPDGLVFATDEAAALQVDVCAQPAEGRRTRLLVADMDSTIIYVECLDELA